MPYNLTPTDRYCAETDNASKLPKKRAIWQNKNTNQLAAAYSRPEITDKKNKSVSQSPV